ncbi:hypothetical protein [Acinetobacter nosocomialis]|uniref:hypothetical protein n=1 Tax=Acinetobacter nosocomialis TaxID=106654 RepID=UPI00374EC3B7
MKYIKYIFAALVIALSAPTFAKVTLTTAHIMVITAVIMVKLMLIVVIIMVRATIIIKPMAIMGLICIATDVVICNSTHYKKSRNRLRDFLWLDLTTL